MKNKQFMMVVILAVGIILVGCASTNGTSTPKPKIETLRYQPMDDGWFRYFTNSKAMAGYAQTMTKSPENPNVDPNVYEFEVKKISGNERCGFGVTFGSKDNNDTSWFMVRINTVGQFGVCRMANRSYKWLTGKSDDIFIDSPNLKKGFDIINTIKIIRNGNNQEIYFNDAATPDYVLIDTIFKGTKINYVCQIGKLNGPYGNENFPDVPVDAYFRAK